MALSDYSLYILSLNFSSYLSNRGLTLNTFDMFGLESILDYSILSVNLWLLYESLPGSCSSKLRESLIYCWSTRLITPSFSSSCLISLGLSSKSFGMPLLASFSSIFYPDYFNLRFWLNRVIGDSSKLSCIDLPSLSFSYLLF